MSSSTQDVWHVDASSPQQEKKACERLSRWPKMEEEWSFVILNKWNWKYSNSTKFNSHAYVLTANGRTVSYLALREKLTLASMSAYEIAWPLDGASEEKPCTTRWLLAEVFTVYDERKKGYAKALLDATMKHKAISFADLAFSWPFSENGEKFVSSFGLSRIKIADR